MKTRPHRIPRRTVGILALGAVTALLAWRLVRPLNIFIVEDRFALPIHESVPEGLSSLSARECGGCHEEIFREWSESMHAMAWTEPYFQVDFRFDGSQQICLNCHTPFENQQEKNVIGFRDRERFDPILEPNTGFDASFRDEGVTCAACHVKGGKILGPFGITDAPHPIEADPSMASGIGPCIRCHMVSGRRWDTFYRVPPCGTVAEIAETGEKIDCVGCHMPEITRPLVEGGQPRKGRKHLFLGGHDPATVSSALQVEHREVVKDGDVVHEVTLTNTGAAHYLPTGTPDRHLTLELSLLDDEGMVLSQKTHKMKREILWRPIIMDLRDTRLPFGKPVTYSIRAGLDGNNRPAWLDVTVRYHLLDEARRRRIGYENRTPIAYPVYQARFPFHAPVERAGR